MERSAADINKFSFDYRTSIAGSETRLRPPPGHQRAANRQSDQ
jgi:hypothetical protein